MYIYIYIPYIHTHMYIHIDMYVSWCLYNVYGIMYVVYVYVNLDQRDSNPYNAVNSIPCTVYSTHHNIVEYTVYTVKYCTV